MEVPSLNKVQWSNTKKILLDMRSLHKRRVGVELLERLIYTTLVKRYTEINTKQWNKTRKRLRSLRDSCFLTPNMLLVGHIPVGVCRNLRLLEIPEESKFEEK